MQMVEPAFVWVLFHARCILFSSSSLPTKMECFSERALNLVNFLLTSFTCSTGRGLENPLNIVSPSIIVLIDGPASFAVSSSINIVFGKAAASSLAASGADAPKAKEFLPVAVPDDFSMTTVPVAIPIRTCKHSSETIFIEDTKSLRFIAAITAL